MKRLAIVGGGQLARMLALKAHTLGAHTFCLESTSGCCASEVTNVQLYDKGDITSVISGLREADAVTFETENTSPDLLMALAKLDQVFPDPNTIYVLQDRLREKDFITSVGIPTTPYKAVESFEDAIEASETLDFPMVMKTRQGGYDGKGQRVVHSKKELEEHWSSFAGRDLILEQWCAFDYECSLISVRNIQGEIRCYPLTLNHHRDGILHTSQAPFASNGLQEKAQTYAKRLLEQCQYVGVMTIEFFVCEERLLVNEIAPRVHNSGHWTIEGAQTSQFENHLRAVLGWPLGATECQGHSIMLNLLGEVPHHRWMELLSIEGVHPHIYGKTPRPQRKVGHITVHAEEPNLLADRYQQLLHCI